MNLVEKCKLVEEKLSRERGGFSLFGLFERLEGIGKWDILVSAPWLETDRAAIHFLVNELAPVLQPEDWMAIAGVMPLKTSADFVQWITQRYTLEHGTTELINTIIADVDIRRGYLITANPRPVGTPQYQAAA